MTPSVQILRLRAAFQEAQAAENRAWALCEELLPNGSDVIVYGSWRAKVYALPMPLDGSMSVIPFDDDLHLLSRYELDRFKVDGHVNISAGSFDIPEKSRKRAK